MNTTHQVIAIAEACGAQWRRFESGAVWITFHKDNLPGYEPCERPDNLDNVQVSDSVPSYLNNLNAVRAARIQIFAQKPGHYDRWFVIQLREVLKINCDSGQLDLRDAYQLTGATAHQEAEALLKCLGLWPEIQDDYICPHCGDDPCTCSEFDVQPDQGAQ